MASITFSTPFFMLAISVLLTISGCRGHGKSESRYLDKMDAPLRMMMIDFEENHPDSMIPVLMELATQPDQQLLDLIEGFNVEISTVSGNILTVKGKASDLRKLAAEAAVVSLSLSQERSLNR